ncbi:MAG: sulfur carrier protein ThiS, partial [Gemmatimonadales bacterium]
GHETSDIIITLNGEEREIPSGLTIRDLLNRLDLHERLVVVERNREIVRREEYEDVTLNAGDAIELVHFVGGG